LATLITVLSGGTALFDWFGKTVHPVTPPPAKIDARVSRPVLQNKHESLGDYARDINAPTTGLTNYQLAEQGFVFLIRIHLQGNQGRRVLLRWSIIDNATGSPLQDPIYNQDQAFQPRGPDQERQWPIWVPSPPRRGTFILRATLIDDSGHPLDQADSKPFTVAKAPGPYS
jgi:hypothetical protein